MSKGACFGLIQLFFALTWTVYAVFLPALAESAGIARKWVVWILIADQLIFILMDLALGVAADRIGRNAHRLGPWIAAISAISCAVFVCLPFAPLGGDAAAAILLAAIVVWSATASALRAPLVALLAKHSRGAQTTWLTNLALLGLGLAGAIAPALTAKLRGLDPRLPFVLAGLGLLVATAALRKFGQSAEHDTPNAPEAPAAVRLGPAFFAAFALLTLGFQVHAHINTAPAFLRFAAPPMLDALMSAFWVGFNLLILPSAWLIGRSSSSAVLALGATAGAASLAALGSAPNLAVLTALQLAAGGGWALVLAGGIGAAIDAGRTGHEGGTSGVVFALLAFGAAVRLGLVAVGVHKAPDLAPLLGWLPALCWTLAAGLCWAWARRSRAPATAAGTPP
jgi:hypothetical protein